MHLTGVVYRALTKKHWPVSMVTKAQEVVLQMCAFARVFFVICVCLCACVPVCVRACLCVSVRVCACVLTMQAVLQMSAGVL